MVEALNSENNLYHSFANLSCTSDMNSYNNTQVNSSILENEQNERLQWNYIPPSLACELLIKRIPSYLADEKLILHFQRFGPIYEFRLMTDIYDSNGICGYIKYMREIDAARAKEVMNHFYVGQGKVLEVHHSYDKCRLFVGNIPKGLTYFQLEKSFRYSFPMMEKLVMNTRICDGNRNRGFVFIDFPSHKDALNIKLATPGRINKWGRDLSCVWANPEPCPDPIAMKNVKTLFVRNVDFSVNTRDLFAILVPIIERSLICKISRIREFAFIDFATREAAERVMFELQGTMLKGHNLQIEWAKPPSNNSVHTLRNIDFDSVVRLKCIANYWSTPIIIFGRVFEPENLQYAAVLLRSNGIVCAFLVEIETCELADIHSRLCEVVVTVIEQNGYLPRQNYVIKVKNDRAFIVGIITNLSSAEFCQFKNVPETTLIFWNEIMDLSFAIATLAAYPTHTLLQMFKDKLESNFPFFDTFCMGDRILACLNPDYRRKPPLKYNLNNSRIVFVLCHRQSLKNYIFPYEGIQMTLGNISKNVTEADIKNLILVLLPIHFAQSKRNEIVINKVYFHS